MPAAKAQNVAVLEAAIATSKDAVKVFNSQVALAQNRRKELLKIYREEPLVPMYLSPMYRPYLGNVMTVYINGIHVSFSVDGSTQMVPQTFADDIVSKRLAIDATITKQNRMANIKSNFESAPGELKLF